MLGLVQRVAVLLLAIDRFLERTGDQFEIGPYFSGFESASRRGKGVPGDVVGR